MSWQAYVDVNLLGTGNVTAAGIYDLKGNPWACSAGFAAQVEEVAAVSDHFATPPDLAATGVTIAGVKYMFVRGYENEDIYVKRGNTGVCFRRCKTCIIVGYHDDTIQPGACRCAVENLADYLVENNI